MGVATRHLRRAAPVVASGTVVLTLVTCLVVAKMNKVYTGGLTWPYFSDLGRGASNVFYCCVTVETDPCLMPVDADSPGYYVFCVGLTIVAIALCATWYFNYQFQSSALRIPTLLGHVSTSVLWTARACTFSGIISTIGLPILVRDSLGMHDGHSFEVTEACFAPFLGQAFFSTSSYPSLHNNAAYWFFLLETIAIFLNTYVSHKLVQSAKVPETTAGEIPVICDFEDIDADTKLRGMRPRCWLIQCLERDLGQEYCRVAMKYNDVYTKLWNYVWFASQSKTTRPRRCEQQHNWAAF
ncbi:hypothetical protein ON010_g17677 [Phytophthora cinnamomi]|nr:hypothetical protein ON010_g17677 [Phytophthora cinnamomi]